MIAPSRRAVPNVVDSSAWLEYFADSAAAKHFAGAIEAVERLVVPSVCLLEVFKVVLRQRGEGDALQAVALMLQGKVVELDAALAMASAKAGVEHKLPLADSVVYATAQAVGGVVWTQDEDFDGLPGVEYFPKQAGNS
ncbi:MAG TPA: type II toxin-antitoxin system VapC family toxin [Gemmatimonadaceae bacterium]|nr:type II toxin-antitoxin system VapC family toxin [Gemmatimonadaceae bacterium]